MIVAAVPDTAAREDLAKDAPGAAEGRNHAAISSAVIPSVNGGSICGRRITHRACGRSPDATSSWQDLVLCAPRRPAASPGRCFPDHRQPAAGPGRGNQIRMPNRRGGSPCLASSPWRTPGQQRPGRPAAGPGQPPPPGSASAPAPGSGPGRGCSPSASLAACSSPAGKRAHECFIASFQAKNRCRAGLIGRSGKIPSGSLPSVTSGYLTLEHNSRCRHCLRSQP